VAIQRWEMYKDLAESGEYDAIDDKIESFLTGKHPVPKKN
jgi:hypothetical protein